MRIRLRRTTVLACIVGSLAIAAGGAVAATELGTDSDQQAIVDEAAERLGVSPQQLTDALTGAVKSRIDAAVAAGELTAVEGARLREQAGDGALPFGMLGGHALDERHMAVPFGFEKGGPAFGTLGPGPEGLEPAAAYLGLSREALRTQLNSGKTLAEVAKAQGKAEAGLVDAMLAAMKTKLDRGVTTKDLTAAEAADILADAREQTESMLDAEIRIHERGMSVEGPFKGAFGFGGGPIHHGPVGLEPAAEFLGLSPMELKEQLGAGKTLAQLAKAQGKTKAGLVDAMVAGAKAKLDAAIADGDLSEAEAKELLADAREHAASIVDAEIGLHERRLDKMAPSLSVVPGAPALPVEPGSTEAGEIVLPAAA